MKKKRATISINLNERSRTLLAKAGYISYQNCKGIDHGKISSFFNGLIEKALGNIPIGELFLVNQLNELEDKRDKLEINIAKTAQELIKLRDKKKEVENENY